MPRHDRYRTGNQSLMRELNLSVVVSYLRHNPATSRAALATWTGLSKPAVSSLVAELLDHEFIREVGTNAAGIGRPSVQLELNPSAGSIVSAELGVDFITVIATDFAGDPVWRHREERSRSLPQTEVISHLLDLLEEARTAGRAQCGPTLGVALGVPGLVDQTTGTLVFAPNLGWQQVPMRALLKERFAEPVTVDNESHLGALGEYYFGAAQHYGELLYICADVGLGGSIIHEGSPFGGAVALAGRFGHMTMDPSGEACACGNRGCWETQVSRRALARYIREGLATGADSQLRAAASAPERLSVAEVLAAAGAGDAVALQALDRMGHALGVGIASLVNVLNPEAVVLGTLLGETGSHLMPAVSEELQRHVLGWDGHKVQLMSAKLGYDACVMGGVATVYQEILPQPDTLLARRR
jgi:predicted NBD/HSP70 family sugar kinase